MSSNSGIVYPTRSGMSHGTARESAFNNSQSANNRQVMANSMAAGGKMKKRYRGGGQTAPQVTMPYKSISGAGTDPNSQIKGNTSTLMQTQANKQYDSGATKMGGSRKKKGGNSNWNWPCSSGGKKRTTKRTKRSRKNKKTRRARR